MCFWKQIQHKSESHIFETVKNQLFIVFPSWGVLIAKNLSRAARESAEKHVTPRQDKMLTEAHKSHKPGLFWTSSDVVRQLTKCLCIKNSSVVSFERNPSPLLIDSLKHS